MPELKELARKLLPAVGWNLLGRVSGRSIVWSGNFPDWPSARARSSGYDADVIFRNVAESARKVRDGKAVFERDSYIFERVIHSYPVLAVLLRAAHDAGGRLSVLDFGGGLGSSYYQCKSFLPPGILASWGIVEQPHFVELGCAEFETDRLKFFLDVATCVESIMPNVILCSGTLQFIEDVPALLQAFAATGADYVVLDRTPMASIDTHRITIQKVPRRIYKASYAGWIFSESMLLDSMPRGYTVLDVFDGLDGKHFFTWIDQFTFKGVILKKSGAKPDGVAA